MSLYAPKYSTHYYTECKPRSDSLMTTPDPNGNCATTYPGAWAKGGTGGGWNVEAVSRREYAFDINFLYPSRLPDALKELFPAGPAVRRRAWDAQNPKTLEADPLRPPQTAQ